MLTRNELFGILTGLVEEHRKTDNFFQALKFKENFFKINTLMNGIMSNYESGVDVIQCFDFESTDQYINSFRYIQFINITGLEEFLKENYMNIIEEISLITGEIEILEVKIK